MIFITFCNVSSFWANTLHRIVRYLIDRFRIIWLVESLRISIGFRNHTLGWIKFVFRSSVSIFGSSDPNLEIWGISNNLELQMTELLSCRDGKGSCWEPIIVVGPRLSSETIALYNVHLKNIYHFLNGRGILFL